MDYGDIPRVYQNKTIIGLHGLGLLTRPEFIRDGRFLGNKIGLLNPEILKKKENTLTQLTTYCPTKDVKKLENSLFNAGAGKVGSKYDQCSFISNGIGSFRPLDEANPYIGSKNIRSSLNEEKLELIFPTYLEKSVIKTLFDNHPYEEVAY